MEALNRVRAALGPALSRLSARRREARAEVPGTMQRFDGGIDDGVDYSTPPTLPGWLRRQMDADPRLRESLLAGRGQTFHTQFAQPYRAGDDLPFMPAADDPLLEWDAATRERVLSGCHAAYQRNPLAHAAVHFTTDFVVGDGFNLVCQHPAVERVLKDFIEHPDNALRKYERQAVSDLQVDGELVLRFHTRGGQTVMVPQRPWELKWIETEAGFFRRPLVYHFERLQSEGDAPSGRSVTVAEDVPAGEIHFVAINDHGYELRGRPELYRVLPWLRADKEWLEERARQNRWRGALLWHVRVENATPATIAAVVQRWRRPPAPGSAYVSTAHEEVRAVHNPAGAADAGHDGRALRLMVILGMRLPEYFFADGANANLATSQKQELPALTRFEAFQQIMVEQVWTPVFRRVLQNAIDAGLLPEVLPTTAGAGLAPPAVPPAEGAQGHAPASPPRQAGERAPLVRTLDAFEVSYEPVAAQDLNALAAMLDLAVRSGWASAQTAAEKLGFDPAVERERIAREA